MSGPTIAEEVFHNCAYPILVLDPDLNILATNRVVAAHFGFRLGPNGKLTSESFRALEAWLKSDPKIAYLAKTAAGIGTRLIYMPEREMDRIDPHTAYEFVRISSRNEPPRIAVEIHPRQAAFEKIFEIQDELGRERAIARDQRQAAKKLEAANEMLNRFAFAAAHDIQEPVRIISVLSDLLMEEGETMDPADLHDCLDQLGEQARRARGIVIDVLEFSRVREMEPQCEQVSLSKIVGDVFEHFNDRLQGLELDISIGSLDAVVGDERMLMMLIQNLVSNAIKYRKGNVLDLRISSTVKGNFVVLEVEDGGVGFCPSKAQEIFEVFKRLHRKDDIPGTGVGLALCKAVVDAHRGFISAEGRPNEGATFSIHLPRAQNGRERRAA